MNRVAVWWRRVALWFRLTARLTGMVRADAASRLALRREITALRSALVEQCHEIAELRDDAERADALREDALRESNDRTVLVGKLSGRLNQVDALTALMPADVAATVRLYTRPHEQLEEQTT